MQVIETELAGVLLLRPRYFPDSRGWFIEAWNRQTFQTAGINADFVQDNLSHSVAPWTVRGLHYQRPPMAQGKLVMVFAGRILDVVVDLRRQSSSYGRHLKTELSAADGTMLFVPAGFAHGFCTLEANVMVFYKVDAPYSPPHEGSIHWRDPDLAIDWPIAAEKALLSPKDLAARGLAGYDHGF